MKILLISTLYAPDIVGGAERSVQLLAEGLRQAGHEPVVVRTGREGRAYELGGVRVRCVRHRNLCWPSVGGGKAPALLKPFWHAIANSNPLVAREIGASCERLARGAGFEAECLAAARRCTPERAVAEHVRIYAQLLVAPR